MWSPFDVDPSVLGPRAHQRLVFMSHDTPLKGDECRPAAARFATCVARAARSARPAESRAQRLAHVFLALLHGLPDRVGGRRRHLGSCGEVQEVAAVVVAAAAAGPPRGAPAMRRLRAAPAPPPQQRAGAGGVRGAGGGGGEGVARSREPPWPWRHGLGPRPPRCQRPRGRPWSGSHRTAPSSTQCTCLRRELANTRRGTQTKAPAAHPRSSSSWWWCWRPRSRPHRSDAYATPSAAQPYTSHRPGEAGGGRGLCASLSSTVRNL